jgi:ABC-type sulfate transport system permease component
MLLADLFSGVGFFELAFLLFGVLFFVPYLAMWVYTLVNCISRDSSNFYPVLSSPDHTKIFWLVIVTGSLFLNCFGIIGLVIYWTMNSKSRPQP